MTEIPMQTTDLLQTLNELYDNQPFLFWLLGTALSGFLVVVIGFFVKRSFFPTPSKEESVILQRGWPNEVMRSDFIELLLNNNTAEKARRLYKQVGIELNMELQRSQVKPRIQFSTIDNKIDEPLPEGSTIVDAFHHNEIRGKLLILGEPGSGKTTQLLELTRHLLLEAKEQQDRTDRCLLFLSAQHGLDNQYKTGWQNS